MLCRCEEKRHYILFASYFWTEKELFIVSNPMFGNVHTLNRDCWCAINIPKSCRFKQIEHDRHGN
jgi:hypothetical protein